MRTLALALLALTLLPACKDPDAEDRIAKLESTVEAQAKQIADLQAQVGAQPDMTGMVASLQSQITDLKQQLAEVKAPKVPHLVVTETDEDLGIWLGGTRTWIADLGLSVDVANTVPLVYESTDCTGTPYALVFPQQPIAKGVFLDPAGHAWTIDPSQPVATDMHWRSELTADGCDAPDSTAAGYDWGRHLLDAHASIPVHSPDDLEVMPR